MDGIRGTGVSALVGDAYANKWSNEPQRIAENAIRRADANAYRQAQLKQKEANDLRQKLQYDPEAVGNFVQHLQEPYTKKAIDATIQAYQTNDRTAMSNALNAIGEAKQKAKQNQAIQKTIEGNLSYLKQLESEKDSDYEGKKAYEKYVAFLAENKDRLGEMPMEDLNYKLSASDINEGRAYANLGKLFKQDEVELDASELVGGQRKNTNTKLNIARQLYKINPDNTVDVGENGAVLSDKGVYTLLGSMSKDLKDNLYQQAQEKAKNDGFKDIEVDGVPTGNFMQKYVKPLLEQKFNSANGYKFAKTSSYQNLTQPSGSGKKNELGVGQVTQLVRDPDSGLVIKGESIPILNAKPIRVEAQEFQLGNADSPKDESAVKQMIYGKNPTKSGTAGKGALELIPTDVRLMDAIKNKDGSIRVIKKDKIPYLTDDEKNRLIETPALVGNYINKAKLKQDAADRGVQLSQNALDKMYEFYAMKNEDNISFEAAGQYLGLTPSDINILSNFDYKEEAYSPVEIKGSAYSFIQNNPKLKQEYGNLIKILNTKNTQTKQQSQTAPKGDIGDFFNKGTSEVIKK